MDTARRKEGQGYDDRATPAYCATAEFKRRREDDQEAANGGGLVDGPQSIATNERLIALKLMPFASLTAIASKRPSPIDHAGLSALHAHGTMLGIQLRALKLTAAAALALNRKLIRPSLGCYCDRDPSAQIGGLLTNGCKLPSGESEDFLPFPCPLEHILDEEAWEDAAAEGKVPAILQQQQPNADDATLRFVSSCVRVTSAQPHSSPSALL